ncbi:MAG: hypothetical protein WAV10_00785 [Minisyncoccia bacterium]
MLKLLQKNNTQKSKNFLFRTGLIFAVTFFIFFVLPTNHAEAAVNTFTGATNSNWGTATNWSQGTVPTASDGHVTTFDATSPNCTVDASNKVANALDFSSYTNTITMTFSITITGNITLGASMNVSGSGILLENATAVAPTLTSNGFLWPNGLTFNGNTITAYTLADDWNIGGAFVCTGYAVLNGFNLYIGGNLTFQGTGSYMLGTTNLIMNGTGTYTHANTGQLRNNLTFNTAGTITISGVIRYNTGTMTYTAGTIVHSTSYLQTAASTTLNLNGAGVFGTWQINGTTTITLLSDMYCSRALFGATTVNANINGAYKVYVSGNLEQNASGTGAVLGTATIELVGSGNITSLGAGSWRLPIIINTSGTYNIPGFFYIINGSLTYTSGTLDWTGSFFQVNGTMTLDLQGQTINDFNVGATSVISLISGFNIAGAFTTTATAVATTISSSVPGTQRIVTLLQGATQNISMINATDIDSSLGQTIRTYRGVLSNTTNWTTTSGGLQTVAYTFVF